MARLLNFEELIRLPWTVDARMVRDGGEMYLEIRVAELPGFVLGVEHGEDPHTEFRDALNAHFDGYAALGVNPPLPRMFSVRQLSASDTSTVSDHAYDSSPAFAYA